MSRHLTPLKLHGRCIHNMTNYSPKTTAIMRAVFTTFCLNTILTLVKYQKSIFTISIPNLDEFSTCISNKFSEKNFKIKNYPKQLTAKKDI